MAWANFAEMLLSEAFSHECRQRLVSGVPPPDAKRMSGWVGVDLITLFGVEVGCRLEQSGPESDCFVVGHRCILDIKIEMYLLRVSIRPLGGKMVRCQLHADALLAKGVEDTMETVVAVKNVPAQDSSPESTLAVQVGGVEHDASQRRRASRRRPGPALLGALSRPDDFPTSPARWAFPYEGDKPNRNVK